VGDMGYVDEEGFLYLADRADFMINSGGVNIYPQEVENLLINHKSIADVAVFGIANEEFGEEVKAVVELQELTPHDTSALEAELIAYCKQHLAHYKCPRSIDFIEKMPRLDNGKLYKRHLQQAYQ
jgi:long-chain acyl-CoA synthetase